ncbi:MAG: AAA family ATPase [Lachnospiraceae bacterium]|nr:AAA family ATPase [Lachnospiraceae bacterium]
MLIEREIRGSSARNFGDYATKLTLAFTWEDIQLTRESAGLLQKAIDRVRLKSVVNGDYGFGKKLPYGNGVSIVLYGPPGTGKTMTAQLLARELGLDLYRIDLSQIESKYIRETQKNLKQIFDTAKYSNAILFFDEADALFAKRTEVNGANERHANAETAFLLQKVEEYNGVSILATNVFTNFDEAFKRRMTFLIPVRWPEEDERIALWKKMFPKEAPLAEDVDFAYYASVGEMTGSWIKNAAVAAAYRAAKEHRPIAHRDILEAIEEEYKKNGRTMRILPEQDKLSQTLDELIREH